MRPERMMGRVYRGRQCCRGRAKEPAEYVIGGGGANGIVGRVMWWRGAGTSRKGDEK
jgi:hypothetical protein